MAGASVELDRNQPTTIGSGADCALRLAEPMSWIVERSHGWTFGNMDTVISRKLSRFLG